jgi:hypothetical protein
MAVQGIERQGFQPVCNVPDIPKTGERVLDSSKNASYIECFQMKSD